MSRRVAKRPVSVPVVRHAVKRLQLATRADEMKGGGDPADIPYIERDLTAAVVYTYSLFDRLMAEREELLAAVREGISLYEGQLSSDYPASYLQHARDNELKPLIALVDKHTPRKVGK